MKLTKIQIEALANKIKRKIQDKIEEEKKLKIDSIKKTSDYKNLENFLNKREELEDRLNRLNEIINKKVGLRLRQSREYTINYFIDSKLPKNPGLNAIIEDITIATIDKDFDAEKFIDNYIKQHE